MKVVVFPVGIYLRKEYSFCIFLKKMPWPLHKFALFQSAHMSYSPYSLKGVIYWNVYETNIRVIKGDIRSLDCSS